MRTVASRDLRNHTADVLRQVAEIQPIRSARPQFFGRADLVELLMHHQADPGLTADLDALAGDTTDDLVPL